MPSWTRSRTRVPAESPRYGWTSKEEPMDPATAFDPVYQQFAFAAAGWYAVLFDYANQLFVMLATIEIGLGAIQWMVAQQSHDYIAMALFRKILWIGFMYAVLLYSRDWIPAILSSF